MNFPCAKKGSPFLLNASFAGSIVSFRGTLIEELIKRGYEVHITAPDPTEQQRQAVAQLGAILHTVPLSRTGLNPISDLVYLRALHKLIKQIQPVFVLNYTVKPNIWGAIASAREHVPSASMVTGLGYAFISGRGSKRGLVQKLMRALYRSATRHNQRVIFQNPDDRDDFIAAGCLVDSGKSAIVNGSGVDIRFFQPVPIPEAPIFLLIARLLWTKGVREYVEAAIRVRTQIPEARFRIAGFLDGGPDAVTETELNDWVAAGIEYLGPLDDVRPAIADASVYVLPSYREGTPRTVLEAMAMGRPIITTDAPGCRETVINGLNGFLAPVRDVDALADAMRSLATDGALRAKMGEASKRIVDKKYAADAVARSILDKLQIA